MEAFRPVPALAENHLGRRPASAPYAAVYRTLAGRVPGITLFRQSLTASLMCRMFSWAGFVQSDALNVLLVEHDDQRSALREPVRVLC